MTKEELGRFFELHPVVTVVLGVFAVGWVATLVVSAVAECSKEMPK